MRLDKAPPLRAQLPTQTPLPAASASRRSTAMANASGVSASSISCPSRTPMPSTPNVVLTIGAAHAIASSALKRVPPPMRIGMT